MQEIKHLRPTQFEQNLSDDLESLLYEKTGGLLFIKETLPNTPEPEFMISRERVDNIINRIRILENLISNEDLIPTDRQDSLYYDFKIANHRWELEIQNRWSIVSITRSCA